MRHRQIACGITISIFLLIWLVLGIFQDGITITHIFSICILLVFITTSFINRSRARFTQGYVLLLESLLIFKAYPTQDVLGWFLLASGIALLAMYGFFHHHTISKSVITAFLIIISLLSAYTKTGLAAYPILQLLCIISMLPIIGMDNMKRIVYSMPDYKTITEELKIREAEVDDLEMQLANQKEKLLSEIQVKEQQLLLEIAKLKDESEIARLRAELEALRIKTNELERRNTELEAEIASKKSSIAEDYSNIETRLDQLEMLSPLTRGEKNLVIRFYLSRGAATNAMLSDELCKSETTIKNTFRSIFRKLNVPSRSALMGQLDDWMKEAKLVTA